MKNLTETKERVALLDSVLADESWQALNLTLKHEALAVLARRKRQRRWLLQGASLSAMALAMLVWSRHPSDREVSSAQGPSSSAAASAPIAKFISEQEMLALFPAGSCVLAEVDGEKQLVFFDPQEAQQGFALHTR